MTTFLPPLVNLSLFASYEAAKHELLLYVQSQPDYEEDKGPYTALLATCKTLSDIYKIKYSEWLGKRDTIKVSLIKATEGPYNSGNSSVSAGAAVQIAKTGEHKEILLLNCGSSSTKAQLYGVNTDRSVFLIKEVKGKFSVGNIPIPGVSYNPKIHSERTYISEQIIKLLAQPEFAGKKAFMFVTGKIREHYWDTLFSVDDKQHMVTVIEDIIAPLKNHIDFLLLDNPFLHADHEGLYEFYACDNMIPKVLSYCANTGELDKFFLGATFGIGGGSAQWSWENGRSVFKVGTGMKDGDQLMNIDIAEQVMDNMDEFERTLYHGSVFALKSACLLKMKAAVLQILYAHMSEIF